ncbi:MAG: hypothetical protein COB73_08080, partial [Flavobacteriaceae bacterium]
MEKSKETHFNKAKEKLDIANKELFKPNEDVVSYSVCKNSQFAIEGYLKGYLNHKENERFILYMPTWREFGQTDTFLDDIIKKLKDSYITDELISKNIKLYIKPHPRIDIKSKSYK